MAKNTQIQTDFFEKQARENSKRGTSRGIIIGLLVLFGGGLLFGAYSGIQYMLNFQQHQHVRNVAISLLSPKLDNGHAVVDINIKNTNAYPISNPLVHYTISNQANEQIAAGQVQIKGTIPAADERTFSRLTLESVSGRPARMHADLKAVEAQEAKDLPKGFPARFSHSLLFSKGDERVAALKELLKEQPDFAPTLTAIGITYEEGNRFAEAIEYYKQAVESSPTNANARYHLGFALLHERQSEEALLQLKKAKELAPLDPAVNIILESLNERLAQPEQSNE